MPGSIGEHVLQERFGTAQRARGFYNHQMLDHLNERMQEFLSRMEMAFIATADGSGEADCSFRAGPPGFVCVLDERTLVYPEYRGNGVMGSLGNIAENGHIGLLFLDFCGDAIGLHVNGRSTMIDHDELLALGDLPEAVLDGLLQEGARQPERWVKIDVVEAYIHCSKHIPQLVKRSDIDSAVGTADPVRKSGDYFKAKHSSRPWVDGAAVAVGPRDSLEPAGRLASGVLAAIARPATAAVVDTGTTMDAAAIPDGSGIQAVASGANPAETQQDPHEQIYQEAITLLASIADSWSASLAGFR